MVSNFGGTHGFSYFSTFKMFKGTIFLLVYSGLPFTGNAES